MRIKSLILLLLLTMLSIGCVQNQQGPSFSPTPEGQGWDFGSRMTINTRFKSSPVIVCDKIFQTSLDGKVYAFDSEKGKLFNVKPWPFMIPQGIRSTPAVHEGILYFGAFDRKLHAVDTSSGQEVFTFQTDGYISASPTIHENALYFGSYDGKFRAIDLTTRKMIWEYSCNGRIRGGAGIAESGVIFGNEAGKVTNLDRATGSLIWEYDAGAEVYGTPCVSSGVVMFGTRDGKIQAVDQISGKEYWVFTPPENGFNYKEEFWASPIADDEAVYIGSTWGRFYALKIHPSSSNCEMLWEPFETKNKIDRGEYIFSEAVINEDRIYFGCNDGKLYCVDKFTGAEVWHFQTLGEIRSKPLIDNGKIIFPSNDHYLYGLNIIDGSPVKGT